MFAPAAVALQQGSGDSHSALPAGEGLRAASFLLPGGQQGPWCLIQELQLHQISLGAGVCHAGSPQPHRSRQKHACLGAAAS